MPNTLKGVKIGGQPYHFDHDYLDNNPLPARGPSDDGKVLSVGNSGRITWSSIDELSNTDDILPTYVNSDYEKILRISDSGGGVELEWASLNGTILPAWDCSYDGVDSGSVLSVAQNGDLVWHEMSQSTSIPSLNDASEGDVLIVGACGSVLEWWGLNGGLLPSWDTSDEDNPDAGKVLSISDSGDLVWRSLS